MRKCLLPEVLASQKQWSVLTSHGIIGEFHRHEVETVTKKASLKPREMEPLFLDAKSQRREAREGASAEAVAAAASRTDLLQKLDRIKDEKNFKGFTPETEQHYVAELEFLKVLHERNLWERANSAYVTGLLPAGALVRFKETGEMLFVVKAYHCAALCWPAEEDGPSVWRKARGCQAAVWKTIFDADEVEVRLMEWRSPLRLFLEVAQGGKEASVEDLGSPRSGETGESWRGMVVEGLGTMGEGKGKRSRVRLLCAGCRAGATAPRGGCAGGGPHIACTPERPGGKGFFAISRSVCLRAVAL